MAKLGRPLRDHLEKLSGFARVARLGSIHRAAESLGVSQSGLSRSIQSLEEALGITLLGRHTRGVGLTAEGKLLLDLAERLDALVDDTEIRLSHVGAEVAGKVAVGTFESIAIYFWPAFLSSLRRKHPQLVLALSTVDEKDHMECLLAGRLQLVVHVEPFQEDRCFTTVLAEDRFNFFRRKDPETDDPAIIYVPDAVDRNRKSLERTLDEAGVLPRARYELDTFESAKALALEGLGTAILPERVARKEVKAGALVAVSVPGFPTAGFGAHRICASVRKEERKERRLRVLLQELKRAW